MSLSRYGPGPRQRAAAYSFRCGCPVVHASRDANRQQCDLGSTRRSARRGPRAQSSPQSQRDCLGDSNIEDTIGPRLPGLSPGSTFLPAATPDPATTRGRRFDVNRYNIIIYEQMLRFCSSQTDSDIARDNASNRKHCYMICYSYRCTSSAHAPPSRAGTAARDPRKGPRSNELRLGR